MPILLINVARWLAPARSARRPEIRHHARARVEDMAGRQARRHVLIVEDEPALRNHYERFFSSRYDLTFASSGAEALERLSHVFAKRRRRSRKSKRTASHPAEGGGVGATGTDNEPDIEETDSTGESDTPDPDDIQ